MLKLLQHRQHVFHKSLDNRKRYISTHDKLSVLREGNESHEVDV